MHKAAAARVRHTSSPLALRGIYLEAVYQLQYKDQELTLTWLRRAAGKQQAAHRREAPIASI